MLAWLGNVSRWGLLNFAIWFSGLGRKREGEGREGMLEVFEVQSQCCKRADEIKVRVQEGKR